MSCAEVVAVLKDIIISVAAVVTAYVAYTGLEKWKTELKGKANFEVARDLIRSVYKLREELMYCRSPIILAHEFPADYDPIKGAKDSDAEGQAYAYVYSRRWEHVSEAVQDFDSARLEAEALWGKEIKSKCENFRKKIAILRSSIDAVIRDKYSGGENFKDKEFAEKMKANVSAHTSQEEPDPLSQGIDSAISEIEQEIQPYLSRG